MYVEHFVEADFVALGTVSDCKHYRQTDYESYTIDQPVHLVLRSPCPTYRVLPFVLREKLFLVPHFVDGYSIAVLGDGRSYCGHFLDTRANL